MVAHELAAIPGAKLAPFAIPFAEMLGAAGPDGAAIFRTRLLLVSAMKRFPEVSTATSVGLLSPAVVAGLPSPENPAIPFPAMVEIVPVPSTLRTRLLAASGI